MSNLTSASAFKAISSLDGPVDLRKYTKLKPDVAKCLCCEADLDLSGLKEFSPQLAQSFARHRGKLILNGVQKLDAKTATALKENFKGELHFGEITNLEDEVAQILSEREGGDGSWKYWPKSIFPKIKKFEDTPGHIAFFTKLVHDAPRHDMHVSELSPKQAEIVAKLDKEINYSSIQNLSPEVAKALSTSNQKIWLSEVKELSVEAANALCEHKEVLSLGNLSYVDDALAMALSKHIGPVRLGGINKMPDTAGYIALAKKLALDEKSYFSANIEEMGEEVANIFSNCDRLNLTSLKKLPDTKGHFKLWEKMLLNAKPEDSLGFYGIKELPDKFAEIASRSPAKVSISLSKWTQEPGHMAWAQKVIKSDASITCGTIYINGEFFPDKISEIFANAGNVELQDIKIFDSSPGNLELARKLASGSKYIRLKKITKEVAKIFAEGKNDRIETSDLEEIDSESFQLLLAHKNHIYLSQLKNLDVEIAKQCEGEKSLGFPAIKSITDEVAESLSHGKGSLNLDGIEIFSDKTLEYLTQREGELSLGGLKALDTKQSKILSQAKGNLNLNSLESICDNDLEELLALEPSKNLNIKSLKSVSEKNAETLSQRVGTLNLEGLEELPETKGHALLAEKLASSWRMDQPRLEQIGNEVAKGLAKNSNVRLGGLKSLSPEVAKELSQVTNLYIPLVDTIDEATANELANLKGELTIGYIDGIDIPSLNALAKNKTKLCFKAKTLTEAQGKILVTIPNLYIEELEEVSFEVAKCFKGYKGEVYISSLKKLSPEAAKELRKLRSKLNTSRTGEYALATGL